MTNIFGDQGNMERNFWEHGNSVKVNLGEHLNLFLSNKGTTVNFPREQGNMHPPGKLSFLSKEKDAKYYIARNFNRFPSNWRFNTASRLHEMKQKNQS